MKFELLNIDEYDRIHVRLAGILHQAIQTRAVVVEVAGQNDSRRFILVRDEFEAALSLNLLLERHNGPLIFIVGSAHHRQAPQVSSGNTCRLPTAHVGGLCAAGAENTEQQQGPRWK